MASIQKRKKANGEFSYRVRIRIEGAPLITETYPTRKEALTFARRMEAEVRAGRYFGKEMQRPQQLFILFCFHFFLCLLLQVS